MTPKEFELFKKIGKIWNDYLLLEVQHESDRSDFMFHIHSLQRIVLSRPELRRYYKNIIKKDLVSDIKEDIDKVTPKEREPLSKEEIKKRLEDYANKLSSVFVFNHSSDGILYSSSPFPNIHIADTVCETISKHLGSYFINHFVTRYHDNTIIQIHYDTKIYRDNYAL